ncbi:ShKT domain-containing protein [Aphelenchoides bicaudatus]|nr:ShKT domain-containing protein [Aphelenchoides bicaudatus]
MPERNEEDRVWLERVSIVLFGFLKQNFFTIVFWSIAACIAYVVFNKLTVPLIHPYYKSWLQFESLLDEMKITLEKGIPEDKQGNPKLVKAYLNVYASFRELRLAAKRDHNDKIDHRDTRWQAFDRIKLPEHTKKPRNDFNQ